MVCKGYAQIEGLDIDETFAPVARLESIRMFLAYACHKEFKFYQLDVKCVAPLLSPKWAKQRCLQA